MFVLQVKAARRQQASHEPQTARASLTDIQVSGLGLEIQHIMTSGGDYIDISLLFLLFLFLCLARGAARAHWVMVMVHVCARECA